jgi:hypothetical protein
MHFATEKEKKKKKKKEDVGLKFCLQKCATQGCACFAGTQSQSYVQLSDK